MLIEPAILLMFNSVRPAAAASTAGSSLSTSLTNSLFDFLCRIAVNYYWPLRERILNGIMQSFKDSVEKRVIPSMQVFFANLSTTTDTMAASNGAVGGLNAQKSGSAGNGSILMLDLKLLIQNTFGNFFQTLNLNQTPLSPFIQSGAVAAATTTTPLNSAQQLSVSPTQMLNTNVKPSSNELASFGSAQSLFKQRKNSEPQSNDESSSSSMSSFSNSDSNSLTSGGGTSPQLLSFQSYFSIKNEANSASLSSMSNMTPIKTETNCRLNSNDFTSLAKTEQFSSDEDEESQPAIKQQSTNNNTENQTILQQLKQNPMATPTPSTSYLILQKQLQAFTSRPFKVFTTIDDTNSILNTNNTNSLENHLNLIQSDDLRDKLTELNEKILSQ